MVNRRAFFEIFFYNRENRSREMMEAAEGVWRAYMKKYGLGLDAGSDGQPTYDEVKEITYLANAAIEAVEKQIAEAEAEEERRKKVQKEAWDLGIFVPVDTATDELEALVMKTLNKQTEEAAEEAAEETVEEAAAEEIPEEPEDVVVEAAAQPVEKIVEEPVREEPVKAVPVQETPVQKAPVPEAPVPKPVPQVVAAEPVSRASSGSDMDLWVDQLILWCRNKGMQCITSMDEGDCYLHVYLPYKKKAHSVGTWCFKKDTNGAVLAAEMTRLYAYCEGYMDCFEQLIK